MLTLNGCREFVDPNFFKDLAKELSALCAKKCTTEIAQAIMGYHTP